MKKQEEIVALEAAAMGSDVRVTDCTNLMPARGRGSAHLSPAGPGKEITGLKLRDIHSHLHEDGDETVLYGQAMADGTVTVWAERAGALTAAVTLDAFPQCAVSSGNEVILMLADGPVRLIYDAEAESWSKAAEGAQGAALPVVTARTSGRTGVTVTGMSAGTGGTVSKLSDTALRALSSELLSGYRSLHADTLASGLWCQPALVMSRVLDASGEVLAESPVTLIAPDGWQCVGPLSGAVSSASATEIPSLRLEALAYQLSVRMPSVPDPSAATVEIVELPALHPVDFKAQAVYRVSGAQGSQRFEAWLPGATAGMSDLGEQRGASLARLAASGGESGRVIARIDAREQAGATVTVKRPSTGGLDEEMAECARALAAEPQVKTAKSSGLFTARHVACNGGAVLWGDVTELDEPVACFVQQAGATFSTDTQPWLAAVEVKLAGGGRLVTRSVMPAPRPLSYGPLLMCSIPRALSVTLWSADAAGANVKKAEMQLKGVPAGSGVQYAVTDGLSYVEPVAVAGPVPESTAAVKRRSAGTVWAAPSSAPLRRMGSCLTGSAAVEALTPGGGDSTLDMSRARFLAFTRGGTLSVNVDVSSGAVAAVKVDPRGVKSAEQVAHAPGGVYAASEGRLLKVTGRKVSDCGAASGVVALAWNPADGALWTMDAEGSVTARLLPGMEAVRRVLSAPARSLFTACSSLRVLTDRGVIRPDAGPDEADVRWEAVMEAPRGKRAVEVAVDLEASRFEGSVKLASYPGVGKGEPRTVLNLEVSGAPGTPLRSRVMAPPRSRLAVSVEGRASADFEFRGVKLLFK